ncbi:RNase A-like domain-containing protein [Streptomyces sp. PvR034]|uniref:RNase A-like domain-containing protein n=1 Tax=Streptomyces sp. PvR034 TaxID=3156401 RepID=UPI00339AC07A
MSTPTPSTTTTPQPPQSSTTPHPGTTQLPSQGQPPNGPALPSPVPQTPPTAPGTTAPPPDKQTLPGPPPPVSPIGQNGVIDVTPTHLYQVSDALAFEQHSFHTVATQLLDALAPYVTVGGKGSAAAEFSAEYVAVAELFLHAHAKSVHAIGGAAVGFNETADNFGEAEAASHPDESKRTGFVRRQPEVMFSEPRYAEVPAPGSSDANPVEDFLDVLDGNIAGDVVRWAVEEALRAGRALEILPLPNYLRLNEVSRIWLRYVTAAGIVEGQLIQTINAVTDSSKGEWYDAMLQFCSSLWGTKKWGQSREGYSWSHDSAASPGMNHPVFGVLSTTAEKCAEALRLYAEAAQLVRTTLRNILHRAIMDALKVIDPDRSILDNVKRVFQALGTLGAQVLAQIIANIDIAEVNAAVDAYESTVRNQKATLNGLRPALQEALLSVPTFQSEMARANAFAARSLFEFGPTFMPTTADGWTANHRYPMELAGMEGLSGAHTIDSHVGLTPDQLAQRLRDQPGIGTTSASTFPDLYSAQRFTRATIDDTQMGRKILKWLKNQRANSAADPDTYDPATRTFDDNFSFTEVTGTSLAPGATAPQEVRSVHFSLRFDPVTKNFIVLTSYPVPP